MYPNHQDNNPADMTMIAAVGELHHAFNKWMGEPKPIKRPAAYRRALLRLLDQVRNALKPAQVTTPPQGAAECGD